MSSFRFLEIIWLYIISKYCSSLSDAILKVYQDGAVQLAADGPSGSSIFTSNRLKQNLLIQRRPPVQDSIGIPLRTCRIPLAKSNTAPKHAFSVWQPILAAKSIQAAQMLLSMGSDTCVGPILYPPSRVNSPTKHRVHVWPPWTSQGLVGVYSNSTIPATDTSYLPRVSNRTTNATFLTKLRYMVVWHQSKGNISPYVSAARPYPTRSSSRADELSRER